MSTCAFRSCVYTRVTLGLAMSLAWSEPIRGQESELDTPNRSGVLRTITLDGNPLDLSNPFFQSLGTNGRSCASCHVASRRGRSRRSR